jgi:hypothetical protein
MGKTLKEKRYRATVAPQRDWADSLVTTVEESRIRPIPRFQPEPHREE